MWLASREPQLASRSIEPLVANNPDKTTTTERIMNPMQITTMQEKVRTAAATALAPGELDTGLQKKKAIWEADHATLKSSIKGSLLKMKDGSWAWVGLQRALVEQLAL